MKAAGELAAVRQDRPGVIIVDVRGIEGWWSQGERILITLGGAERTIFVRRLGAGPSMTLLHGFPSCS